MLRDASKIRGFTKRAAGSYPFKASGRRHPECKACCRLSDVSVGWRVRVNALNLNAHKHQERVLGQHDPSVSYGAACGQAVFGQHDGLSADIRSEASTAQIWKPLLTAPGAPTLAEICTVLKSLFGHPSGRDT